MKNDDFLMHYASEYYDPVKAHEYYMRTRELKGRRSSAQLTEEGKEKWAYVKNQISSNKKNDNEKAAEEHRRQVQETRQKAEETRQRITQKLKELNDKLSGTSTTSKDAIRNKTTAEIEKLKKLKESPLSKKQREAIDAKISKLKSSEKTELSKVDMAVNKSKKQNSNSSQAERKQCATQLKSVISATRASYKKSRENSKASYDKIYDDEYNKIKKSYGKTK